MRTQQLIDGRVWSADASYKVAKVSLFRVNESEIRLPGRTLSSAPFHAIFTIFNEYEQVLFQKLMRSSSLSELRDDFKMLLIGRFIWHGFSLPSVLFTDDCCEDRAFWEDLIDEITAETGVQLCFGQSGDNQPQLTLDERVQVIDSSLLTRIGSSDERCSGHDSSMTVESETNLLEELTGCPPAHVPSELQTHGHGTILKPTCLPNEVRVADHGHSTITAINNKKDVAENAVPPVLRADKEVSAASAGAAFQSKQLPDLELVMEPLIVTNAQDSILLIERIRKSCARTGVHVVGMDCEWELEFSKGPQAPATLQLATSDGFSAVFRLIIGKQTQMFPSLQQLLEDSSFVKVGNCIGDATRIERSYGYIVKNTIDLPGLGVAKGILGARVFP